MFIWGIYDVFVCVVSMFLLGDVVVKIVASYLEPRMLVPFFITGGIPFETKFKYDMSVWEVNMCCDNYGGIDPYAWEQIFRRFRNVVVTGIKLRLSGGINSGYNLGEIFDELCIGVGGLEKVEICVKGYIDVGALEKAVGLRVLVIGGFCSWGFKQSVVRKAWLSGCVRLRVLDLEGCDGCREISLPACVVICKCCVPSFMKLSLRKRIKRLATRAEARCAVATAQKKSARTIIRKVV